MTSSSSDSSSDSSDSSSTSSTSSEEEVPKQTNAQQPTKLSSDSESSDSDSDSESSDDSETEQEKAVKSKAGKSIEKAEVGAKANGKENGKAKVNGKKVSAEQPTKAKSESDDSESSESSSEDSDDEEEEKEKEVKKGKIEKSKTEVEKNKKVEADEEDDSTSSDSSDEEEQEVEKSATKKGVKIAEENEEEGEDENENEVEETEELKTDKKSMATPKKTESGEGVKLDVLGYPFETTEDDLRNFFKDCNVTNIEFGDDRGSCVIVCASQADANKAKELDGQYIGKRWVKVKDHRDFNRYDSSKSNVSGGRETSNGECPEGCVTLFCGNLSFDIDDDAIKNFFKSCGEIKQVRWGMDKETDTFKGFGFVEFYDSESAANGMKLNGQQCCGRAIRLDFAQSKAKPERNSFGGDRGGRGGGRGGGFSGRGGKRPFNSNNRNGSGNGNFSGNKKPRTEFQGQKITF